MHRRAPAIEARLGPSPFGAEHSGRWATPGTGDTRYAPAIHHEAQAKHEARSSAVESRKYPVRLDYISKYTFPNIPLPADILTYSVAGFGLRNGR
jgi:hypothetical protein